MVFQKFKSQNAKVKMQKSITPDTQIFIQRLFYLPLKELLQ